MIHHLTSDISRVHTARASTPRHLETNERKNTRSHARRVRFIGAHAPTTRARATMYDDV